MSLTGDVNTLALSDLVQVSVLNGRSCQIHVIAPHAEGDIFVDTGRVVHAWWGDLVGAEAVYAMLNAPDVGFHVRTDVGVEAQTIAASWQQLVLEAARRQDHNSVPRPKARSSARWRTSDLAEPRRSPPRALWLVATLLLLGGVGALAAARWRQAFSTARAPLPAAIVPATVVDASELTGPGDALPRLMEGAPPSLPRSEYPVAPTIVCRIVVDADGVVQSSRVYRSRLELAQFEEAALTAIERWRFSPGRRRGAPVAVAINWPVTFTVGDARPIRTLRIKGSDTIGGALAPALARAFHARRPDLDVSIEALGSKTAFVGLFDGSADLGASSRPVTPAELQQAARLGASLREFVIAYDGIAVIVHPKNPLPSLTLDDAGRIFRGEVRDWSELGGAAGAIRVITRPSYSGTRSFFADKVLRRGGDHAKADFVASAEIIEDNRALVDAVAADERAIAYVGHGWLLPSVRALPIAPAAGARAIAPETATIRDGSYPIYRPLLFYTRGTPSRDAADFLSFVLGVDGQALVRTNGFVALDAPSAQSIEAGEAGDGGTPIEPVRIAFAAASARPAEDARAKLSALVDRAAGAHLLVIGHSDARGAAAANHRLALARAQRIAAALTALGADGGAIEVQADDADAPVASNDSADGRRQNRRVDIFVLPSR